jgi:serine/threonine protein kinase
MFTLDEFDVDDSDTIQGTYGSVVRAVHRQSQTPVIIKTYRRNYVNSLPPDAAREIALTGFLNGLNPNTTVRVYGLIVADAFSLVQEAMVATLDVVFPTMDKSEHKRVLFDLISNTATVNNAGVQHNDLSCSNIMVDSEKRIRFIDFGMAEYWGIAPRVNSVHGYEMNPIIAPPTPDSRKTLNSDVFSIGATFLNLLMGKTELVRYVSRGNSIYTVDKDERVYFEDPLLEDVLSKMLDEDSQTRWFAKECLEHEYFTGHEYNVVRDYEDLTVLPEGLIVRYSCTNNELLCRETIRDAIMNRTLIEKSHMDNVTEFGSAVEWLMGVFEGFRVSIDAVVSVITKLAELTSTRKLRERDIRGYGCALAVLMGEFYDPDSLGYAEMSIATRMSFRHAEIAAFSRTIVQTYPNYSLFIPVSSLIEYVVVEHQRLGTSANECMTVEAGIKSGLLKWAFANTGPEPRIWDVITGVHSMVSSVRLFERNPTVESVVRSVDSLSLASIMDDYSRIVY